MAPVDIAQSGQLGHVELERGGHDANVVEAVMVEAHVLGVDVEELVDEFADGFEVVHVLPDHVGWVVVEAEVVAGDVGEHAAPDGRRVSEVFAAGPFVAGKGHGAVLDTDFDVVVFGEADQGRPDFEESGPVVVDGLGPVAADEGVHDADAEQRGGLDDALDVVDGDLGFVLVGGEGVGIVSEAADGDACGGGELVDAGGVLCGEADDVDVGDAGVAAFGSAGGPAHELDGGEAVFGGELDDLFEGEVGKDGAGVA